MRTFIPLGQLLACCLLPTLPVLGQTPTLVSTTPPAGAASFGRNSSLSATFSQAVNGAANLRLFGNQWRGYRAAASSGDGTSTLRLQPTQAFAPGECLQLTVPATVQSTAGQALGSGYVVDFRAAAGPAMGIFTGTTSYTENNNVGSHTPVLVDLNNDGKLDLVSVNGMSSITLRLGTGTGTFGNEAYMGVDSPQTVAVTDMNNDGYPDLLTTQLDVDYRLRLWLGTGIFHMPFTLVQLSSGIPVYSPQAADVNGDGNQDVVFLQVRPTTTPAGPASSTLVTRLGNGQGGFTAAPDLALAPGVRSVQIKDFNNDGKLDCLVGNPATSQLTTYLGNGQGGFAAVGAAPLSAAGEGFDVADFTNDGILDVVVPDNGTIRVFPGNGQGSFGAASSTTTAAGVRQLSSADVNGDGYLDLLGRANQPNPNGAMYLWLNNTTGGFASGQQLEASAQTVATGDINGDGTLDLVMMDAASGTQKIRLNQALSTAPLISGFSPASGPAGTQVTLNGSNFVVNGASVTAVLIGGVSVPFTVSSSGALTFSAPAAIPHGYISVVTPTGTATSTQAFNLVLAARSTAAALPATVFPNPAREAAQVQLPTGTGPVQLSLYNPLGQLVRHARLVPDAAGRLALDLRDLAPALYTLKLQSTAQSSTQRLVVQ